MSATVTPDRLSAVLRRVDQAEAALHDARAVLAELCTDAPGAAPALGFKAGASSAALPAPVVGGHNALALGQVGDGEVGTDELQRCKHLFEEVDKDGSGQVSMQELRPLLEKATGKRMTDHEFKEVVKKHDFNFDGQLDFDEFMLAFCDNHTARQQHLNNQMYELGKENREIFDEEMRTPMEQVQEKGVKRAAVLRYLRKELEETSACLQLPQALGIFCFFTLAVMWHFQFESLHGVDEAITWDIMENANFAFSGIVPFENGRMGHKNLDDVNSIADFWSWIGMGIVPLFWPMGWDVNEVRVNTAQWCMSAKEAIDGYGWDQARIQNLTAGASRLGGDACPEPAQATPRITPGARAFFGGTDGVDGTYLLYHTIVGGVRMQQEKTGMRDCTSRDEAFRASMHSGKCVDSLGYWLMPENRRGVSMDKDYLSKQDTVYLLSGSTQAQVRQRLRELEDAMWFNPETTKVELLFTTYNPHEDLITATYINLFLNRGGHIHKIVEPVSFYLHPYHGWWCWFVDIVWVILILKLFAEESIELMRHWRQLGCVKGTRVYMGPANAVDWVSILYAFVLIFFWALQLNKLAGLKSHVKQHSSYGTLGNFDTDDARAEFFSKVDSLVVDSHLFRTMLAVYPFVIVSRFFKAFSSQPRLAMVTNTLSKAGVDIIHFGIVFLTVFVIFAVSALILYGQEMDEFANFSRALHNVFLALIGDFDWDAMTRVGRPQSYLWFWSFVWLLNLVMLNMLLAIIMDVYTDVKGSIGNDAETLWSQSREIYVRWRDVRQGHSIPLSTVLKALDPTDLESEDGEADDSSLMVENFIEEVPSLSQEQAQEILLQSYQLSELESRPSETLTDATIKIQRIDRRVMQVQNLLNQMMQINALQRQQTDGGQRAVVSSVAI